MNTAGRCWVVSYQALGNASPPSRAPLASSAPHVFPPSPPICIACAVLETWIVSMKPNLRPVTQRLLPDGSSFAVR